MFVATSFYKGLDSNVYDWSQATGYQNADGLRMLSNFVSNLKDADIWNKINFLYPFMTDKTDNAGARAQFSFNLVTPTSASVATYINNTSTGSINGWKNSGTDTFVTPARGETEISASYHISLYTTSSKVNDTVDAACYDGANEYVYIVTGRGTPTEVLAAINGNNFISVGGNINTGLFHVQGNTTGNVSEFYVRTTRYSNTSYNSTLKSNFKFGVGSLLQTSNTVVAGSPKGFQYTSIGQFLTQAQVNTHHKLVNELQANLDYVLGSKRAVI